MKVCIDVDAGWRLPGGFMTIGAKRSPLHDPVQVAAFAREIAARPELVLDGLMAYEGQIAGVGDRPPGRPLMRLALPVLQALSARGSWRAGGRRSSTRCAPSRRCGSSTAAGPGRSSGPRPSPP